MCPMQPRGALVHLLPHPDGLSKEALSDFTTPSPTTHRQVAWERDWRSSLLVATIKFLFTCPGPILLERGSLDSVPLSPGQETGWETDVLTWLLIATIRKLNFLTCIMVSNLRALLVFFFFFPCCQAPWHNRHCLKFHTRKKDPLYGRDFIMKKTRLAPK